MAQSFLGPHPWPRITALAEASKGLVAVPFFGDGAARQLPLQAGSVLVTRIDEDSVKRRHVNPAEVLKLIKRGVVVHRCSNLHAKVFVFGRRAVVGSANVSSTSAGMVEACIEATDTDVVRDARAFVKALCVDGVGAEYVRSLIPLYPPALPGQGRGGKAKQVQAHSRMFVCPTYEVEWTEPAQTVDKTARPIAASKLADASRSRLDAIEIEGAEGKKLQPGDRLLHRWQVGRGFAFDAPARVVYLAPYKGGTMVYLEKPKYLRRVSSTVVRSRLALSAKAVLYPSDSLLLIRSTSTVNTIVSLWPILSGTSR